MKYILADKLKAEIERRRLSNRYIDTEGYENELLEIIDSLQQKQSEVELEERKQFAISILCSLCQGVSSARVIFKVDMHCTTIAIDTNRLVEDAVKMTDELIKQLGL